MTQLDLTADEAAHEQKFPTIRCTSCAIQYGGFQGDVASGCPHCGQGAMEQIFPGDPRYDLKGLETAGNIEAHAEFATFQQAQRRARGPRG